jgi:hypothetical protein
MEPPVASTRAVQKMLLLVIVLWLASSQGFASDGPRFLIFHLDAVSSVDFDRAWAEGALPNLERAFEGGTRAHASSLFFAVTPVIYPRMKTGESNAAPGGLSFGGFDREADRAIPEVETFLGHVGSLPRRAVSNMASGIPLLEEAAGLAMLNVPDLLERYGVVEYFWFATDTYGHLLGEAAHRRSLERFDEHLGRLLPRLELDEINLILYADHGITFASDMVDFEPLLEERVGDERRHFVYPNLYLRDRSSAPRVARELTRDGGVEFAFYRVDGSRVHGYLHGAFVRFEAEGDRIRYLSDADPLGYRALGYAGEALTPDEWLSLTIGEHFPATPPNLFGYVQNPAAGDVVLGVIPPRTPLTVRAPAGAHASIVQTDLIVPILSRGPDVGPLAERSELWLHELYQGLPIGFGVEPRRERHELELSWRFEDQAPAARLRLSPAYRLRLAGEATPTSLALWSEHDLVSGYLTRWWVGAGVDYRDGALSPLARGELELDVGDARMRLEARVRPSGWTLGFGATVRVDGGVRLSWSAPAELGIAYHW